MTMTMTVTTSTPPTANTLISDGHRHLVGAHFVDTARQSAALLSGLRELRVVVHRTLTATVRVLALRFDWGVETFRIAADIDLETLVAAIYRAGGSDATQAPVTAAA